MSKYIIEIPDSTDYIVVTGKTDHNCFSMTRRVYELEELNSDYINENFGELQDEAYQKGINDGSLDVKQRVEGAYQRGLEDAWEAAKRIFGYEFDGGIPIEKVREVFGYAENAIFCTADIIRDYTVQEAIEKLKAYEDKQKDRIEVGDIVDRYIDGKFDSKGIFLQEDGGYWRCLFDTNGVLMTFAYPKGQFKKTGKHYDIQSILEAMRTHD